MEKPAWLKYDADRNEFELVDHNLDDWPGLGLPYVCTNGLDKAPISACLDGDFYAHQLRELADFMDALNKSLAHD